MSQTIVFTGGGTAGHVTPNLPLIHAFQKMDWKVAYIGSTNGIEKSMMQELGVPYYGVACGKLRRYLSIKNLLAPFAVLTGIVQAFRVLRRLKPSLVFSKGGFVAFPVVFAAYLNRIPVVAHESDLSPGLANRLSFPFVKTICLTFEGAKKQFKRQDKIEVTGTPIREELFAGTAAKGLALCGFNAKKPCVLVIGGSLGAGSINHCIRKSLPVLCKSFQVIHLSGKGKVDPAYEGVVGYCQMEYANETLPDLFAAAAVVISRSGANSLYEILALGKPHVLIPLSAKISRGDQIQNAAYFKKLGVSVVMQDEALTPKRLQKALNQVVSELEVRQQKIKALGIRSATDKIVAIIQREALKKNAVCCQLH
jgi:UDP-N-acetylglucosamine--N-acetylmuramyl-(pentapeptide) pyrophosphoryl-undecaprenol N-acetylglucosamine transferase